MQTSHSKINNISINGDNNIVIQDVSGNVKIYFNSDEGAKELIADFRQEIGEIRLLLKQRQEPVLQQFAEKIYNIANIENANFYGEGRITIEKAGKITFDRRNLTEKQEDRLEMLEGLERRFQKRLNEKMKTELRFQLELNLEYTKEGTNETYLKDYYIDSYEEKSAESFERLFQDYERTLKRLLILGEAGSGKTVLMLQFGLKLVELAKQNFEYPTPVLLNLATWRDENQTFETWLEENLVFAAGEYRITRKYAKKIAEENNLLLLLDGLDEIPETDRKACLDKLRSFLDKLDNSRPADRNFPTVIISSRKQDYLALSEQAPVRASISLADLTDESVCKELERIKKSGSDFAKKLLNCIAEMPEIATKLKSAFEVHLSLTMAHTFDFSQLSTENLVKTYVNQEIGKLEKEEPKAKHYLSFLATKMNENKKVITFELLDMQPDWLNQKYKFGLVAGLAAGLVTGLVSILVGWLNNGKSGFVGGLTLGLIVGGLVLIFNINKGISVKEIQEFELKKFSWSKFIETFVSALVLGFLGGRLAIGFFLGLVGGLIVGFFSNPSVKRNPTIQNPYKRLYASFLFDFIQYGIGFFTIVILFQYFSGEGIYELSWLYFLFLLFFILMLTILTSPLAQHFLLRILLYQESKLPLQFVRFLTKVSGKEAKTDKKGKIKEKAVKGTGIMEKDGGQWRFRHQLLMEALINKRTE